jgi:hypothetical protein
MVSGGRLLLCALVKGLGDAVRRNDELGADRYRRRLRLAVQQFETNPPVREALELLLWASGQWLSTDGVERDENKERIFELSQHIMKALSPSAAG